MTGGAATTRHNRMMKIFIRILELACEVARLLSDASCRKKYKSFNFNVRICGCGVVVPHLTSNYFFMFNLGDCLPFWDATNSCFRTNTPGP